MGVYAPLVKGVDFDAGLGEFGEEEFVVVAVVAEAVDEEDACSGLC